MIGRGRNGWRVIAEQGARRITRMLDEIGLQHGSESEKIILFEILNERYMQCKPTILISNLDIKDLKEYITERIIDRMRDGGGQKIVFDWESNRG